MPTNEIDLFSWNLEPKKIKNKVRLIELFAGIGAQAKSLEALGVDFEHYKLAEWAVPSIIAYNSIHIKDTTDYSKNKTVQEMLERIKGVSTNYNEPISFEKLKNKPIEWIRNVYNNCIATNNLINIMDIKGKDLEIVDKEKYEYIMTYSFPCQDLSLAGKRAGMSVSQSEGGTRSGLLWEVERILNELERERALPQILLCENVPEIMSEKSMKDLQKWVSALEKLGYKSYDTILNAKNYGLPQNRKRFFMISILGEYSYEFPSPINLKWKLKDFLEKEVDEKYFLSKSTIERISKWKAQQDPLKDINREKEISPTLTARGAGEEHSGMVLINENLFQNNEIIDFASSEQFLREHTKEEYPTLITKSKFAVVSKYATLRIRKLTSRECMRLMGFQDKDTEAMYNAGLSDSAIYHCAGDSICVNVLVAIFALLFDKDYKEICARKNY